MEKKRLPRFFIDERPTGEIISLSAEDAHHIGRVLRMKTGETLTICDGTGVDYQCILCDGGETAQIVAQVPSAGEPWIHTTLYMGLPKGDKMDWIVQKAVELGVCEIVPYLAERSVSRPDRKALEKKVQRWQKIAREAAMQSGRGRIPTVWSCCSFREAVDAARQTEMPLFFYEQAHPHTLQSRLQGQTYQTVGILIGPEGGFAQEEVAYAQAQGLACMSLGARILRCETAPLAAITAVMYASGNL